MRHGIVGAPPEGTPVKSLELVQAAARNCLEQSSYNKSDIDLLIFAGVYRDDFISEPAIASIVAGEMRIKDTIASQQDKKKFAFDVFKGALGFFKACHAAAGMIAAKQANLASGVAFVI